MQRVAAGDKLAAYHAHLRESHDFQIRVDVLHANERPRGSLSGQFLDGQVNIHPEGAVRRTATLQLHDPDRNLGIDGDSAFDGSVGADRIIRVRHLVTVPGVGRIAAVPFVGLPVRVTRDGSILTVECQDKALFGVEGCPPMTVKKGQNAVRAIRRIAEERMGEAHFRFPANSEKRLTKPYSVGWQPDAAPWVVMQKIAKSIGMQLLYSCDGYLTLRRKPSKPVLTVRDRDLTSPLVPDVDFTQVRNHVRVTGRRPEEGAPPKESASTPARHPMSPQTLGRNGARRFLPLLVDEDSVRTRKEARKRARDLLEEHSQLRVRTGLNVVPMFHLDVDDMIRVDTADGSGRIRFEEASIPLGLGGDMVIGAQKRVSKGRRRSR